jgi:hypothetical protein
MKRRRAVRSTPQQLVPPRTSHVAAAALARIEAGVVRQSVARRSGVLVRFFAALAAVVVAALAALAAALAGLVYVVLLPICGLASIAEAFAAASWRTARDRVRVSVRRGTLSQH